MLTYIQQDGKPLSRRLMTQHCVIICPRIVRLNAVSFLDPGEEFSFCTAHNS